MTMFYLCPVDGPVPVDLVDNGVGYTWHGVHCGWGHEFAKDDLVGEDVAMARCRSDGPPDHCPDAEDREDRA